MKEFPFVAGSYPSRSPRFDAQRAVNMYPEMSGSGLSKSIAMLIGCPGTRTWANTGHQGCRGMLRFNSEFAIFIIDNANNPALSAILRIHSDTTVDLLTVFSRATTPVSMASNGTTVMLVTGPEGFFIDVAAGTVTAIVDPAFLGANVVTFLKGRFVWNRPGTQEYQWGEPYSTAMDPLAFASAESAPDVIVSLMANNEELVIVGDASTEFHAPTSDPDLPFAPVQGATISQGCAATFSLAKITDQSGSSTALWLTANEQGQGMVVRTGGYQPIRVSTHAEEYQWAQYSRVDDAIAYTYQQEGHAFYMLSFPTANKTWCYDLSTELWHERSYTDPGTGQSERVLGEHHMFFAGKHLVGDRGGGAVLELDLNYPRDRGTGVGLDTGVALHAIRQCPHISDGNALIQFWELWLDMEMGNTPLFALPGGREPELILEWSDDGGVSFPFSRVIKIGFVGERRKRAIARRLGKSYDRVFRVTITDPVRRVFIGAGVRTTAEDLARKLGS